MEIVFLVLGFLCMANDWTCLEGFIIPLPYYSPFEYFVFNQEFWYAHVGYNSHTDMQKSQLWDNIVAGIKRAFRHPDLHRYKLSLQTNQKQLEAWVSVSVSLGKKTRTSAILTWRNCD